MTWDGQLGTSVAIDSKNLNNENRGLIVMLYHYAPLKSSTLLTKPQLQHLQHLQLQEPVYSSKSLTDLSSDLKHARKNTGVWQVPIIVENLPDLSCALIR